MSKTTQEPFVFFYKSFALPLIKFIVKRMGGDQEASEEVFARTIAAAWEGWKTFKHKSSFFTWICRIALNKIADYYREEINQQSIIVVPLLEEIGNVNIEELSATERLVLDELRSSVRACIKLLPEDKKRLLFLRYWKELTIKQIAKQLGISERAVEGKLYRARKKINEIIFTYHPEILPEYLKKDGRV